MWALRWACNDKSEGRYVVRWVEREGGRGCVVLGVVAVSEGGIFEGLAGGFRPGVRSGVIAVGLALGEADWDLRADLAGGLEVVVMVEEVMALLGMNLWLLRVKPCA